MDMQIQDVSRHFIIKNEILALKICHINPTSVDENSKILLQYEKKMFQQKFSRKNRTLGKLNMIFPIVGNLMLNKNSTMKNLQRI